MTCGSEFCLGYLGFQHYFTKEEIVLFRIGQPYAMGLETAIGQPYAKPGSGCKPHTKIT